MNKLVFLILAFATFCKPCLADEFLVSSEDSLPGTIQPTDVHKGRLALVTGTTASIYLGYMSYLQYAWYKDHERVPFHFYDDMRGYNQVDKFGHIYGAYMLSYISFRSFCWSGIPRKRAALYGGTTGFLMQLPIEIWDGMYEGWGFSWSDVVANGLGSGIVMVQELVWGYQPLKFKFSFWPSSYARVANGYLGTGFNQLLNDYNAHTYWLSGGLYHLLPVKGMPRWINLALGYSAGGMFGEFENRTSYRGVELPSTPRYRQFILSLDIDLTKVPTRNKHLRKVLDSFFMIKIPFPAIEFNTKGDFRFHGLYY